MAKLQPGVNDLATVDRDLARQWHPDRNGTLTPADVTGGSGRKVWWLGPCSHPWEANVANRSNGSGCPFCAGKRVLAGFNDLATTNPPLAAEWHPILNGSLGPWAVRAGSEKKVWWLCRLGHEWQTSLANRKGSGCPECDRRSRAMVMSCPKPSRDLATVKPAVAQQWHPTKNGRLTPADVTGWSAKKVWWLGDCGHAWLTTVASRSNGAGCRICAETGFDPSAPACLYLLHHQVERLVKVGVTTALHRKRLDGFTRSGWIVLDVATFPIGQGALDIERAVLRFLRSVGGTVDPALAARIARAVGRNKGKTETFDERVSACRDLTSLSSDAERFAASVDAGRIGS